MAGIEWDKVKASTMDYGKTLQRGKDSRDTEVEALTRQRDALKSALEHIAVHGNHSGVISCPQDFSFYIEPMRKIAQAALRLCEEK